MPESFRPEGAKCLKINKRQKKTIFTGSGSRESTFSLYCLVA